MRFGTSFFNGTVYKKTLLRFWPVWAANLVFWGMLLPLNGLMVLRRDLEDGGEALLQFARGLGEYGTSVALGFAVVFGLLAGMAVCSHLYSARSANFFGALPVRREGLFFSGYLAGLTMLLAPNVLMFLLTALVQALGGALEWTPLLFWLAALCGMELFFFSFAVCLGMFAGHLLALPVFYGVFNALAAAIYFLLQWVMSEFYYGYAAQERGAAVVCWLTPVWRLFDLRFEAVGNQYRCAGLSAVGIYALAAVALTAAALLLYRGRQLERAGDVVAVKAMRPVFQYGVAICSGLFFGFLTRLILGTKDFGLMAAIILWGLAGYFVARMLLDKTFRVLRHWKGAVAVAAVFAVLFLLVGLDLTGYETRVPDPEQVATVRIQGLQSPPYGDSAASVDETVDAPETIEKIVALHRAAVDCRGEDAGYGWSCRLQYTMKDGSVLSREYDLTQRAEDAQTPGTVTWAVGQLLSDRELIWAAYGFDEMEALEQEGGRLVCAKYYRNDQSGESQPVSIYGADAQALLAAVKADFWAGTIGLRQWGDGERLSMLEFSWSVPAAPADWGSTKPAAEPRERYLQIAVADAAGQTTALLTRLGVK